MSPQHRSNGCSDGMLFVADVFEHGYGDFYNSW